MRAVSLFPIVPTRHGAKYVGKISRYANHIISSSSSSSCSSCGCGCSSSSSILVVVGEVVVT